MKRYILEVLALLAVTLFILLGLFNSHSRSTITDKLNDSTYPLDIINLGTSHGGDFDYEFTRLNGNSFNVSGNTPFYDLQIYRYLKPHLSPSAIIIIPISYFSFGLDENRTDRELDDSFVNQFYSFLPPEQIHNYSSDKERSLTVYWIQQGFFKFFSRMPATSSDQFQVTENYLKGHAVSRARRHKKIGTLFSADENVAYYQELVRDAQVNGFRPVLVAVPYYKSYNEHISDQWLSEHYYPNLATISEELDVPFLDFSHDPRFNSSPELFIDSDHLSEVGKKKFSRIMFSELNRVLNDDRI